MKTRFNKGSRCFRKRSIVYIVLFITFILTILYYDNTKIVKATISPETPHSTFFLSLGDFGTGQPTQHKVARQLQSTAEKYNTTFLLGLGDNFYDNGVTSIQDSAWSSKYENVYQGLLKQIPWYMCLGDHDHVGNVYAQIEYSTLSRAWHMPAPFFSVYYNAPGGKGIHVVVTDSISLEAFFSDGKERRFSDKYNLEYAGEEAGRKQFEWLVLELKESKSDWIIVTGHRPVVSGTERDSFPAEENFKREMRKLLALYGVDVYINGHDHSAQHLMAEGVHYFVNGLGGYSVLHNAKNVPETLWVQNGFNGFLLHEVTSEEMVFRFIDIEGKVVHSSKITAKNRN